jgi:hypothetical protein
MDEETLETTDEVDEVLDWMVGVFSDNSSSSSTADSSPTIELTQYEVGMTGNQIDYLTDGSNWKWFY